MSTEPVRHWPVWCGVHRSEPAIAVCTHCDVLTCSECRVPQPDGRTLCAPCSRVVGVRVKEKPAEKGLGLDAFFSNVASGIRHPRRYAEAIDVEGRILPAYVFGLIATLIGQIAFFLYLHFVLQPDEYMEQFSNAAAEYDLTIQKAQLLSIAVLPLVASARLVFGGVLLQLGAALSGSKALRFGTYFRFFCYASVGQLLLLVPVVGVILTLWYVIGICWHSMHSHHGLSSRKTLVSMIPLVMGIMLMSLAGT